jgi:hypothetical protein
MSFTWTDELKAQAIKDYEAAEPKPDNSMEIVKAQAEVLGCTANGLRTILSRAEVYIKKTPAAKAAATSKDGKPASTRVSKADAVVTLNTAIKSVGLEPDDEIISKLTGKAALYFAEVINSTTQTEEEED